MFMFLGMKQIHLRGDINANFHGFGEEGGEVVIVIIVMVQVIVEWVLQRMDEIS